jgi:hypothetical protein
MLTVTATSSDFANPPELTALDQPLVDGELSVEMPVPPETVTVTSEAGGKDTDEVTISGPAKEADEVVAQPGPNLQVQQGQQVTLDGSGSLNATDYAWSQVDGEAVELAGADTAQASFTAPGEAGTLTFQLTATGPGGSSTNTVTVEVLSVTTPIAHAGADQSALVGATVTLDGSASTGSTGYQWSQTDGTEVQLSDAAAVRPTFTMPATTAPLTFRLVTTGPGGESEPAPVGLEIEPVRSRLGGRSGPCVRHPNTRSLQDLSCLAAA